MLPAHHQYVVRWWCEVAIIPHSLCNCRCKCTVLCRIRLSVNARRTLMRSNHLLSITEVCVIPLGVNFSFYSPKVWMTKFSTLTLWLKGRMSVRCALTGRGWMFFCLSHCVQAARCQSLLNEDFYLRITSGSVLICRARSLQDKIRLQPKQKKRLQKRALHQKNIVSWKFQCFLIFCFGQAMHDYVIVSFVTQVSFLL